jgi:hypothetical protein
VFNKAFFEETYCSRGKIALTCLYTKVYMFLLKEFKASLGGKRED